MPAQPTVGADFHVRPLMNVRVLNPWAGVSFGKLRIKKPAPTIE